MQKGKGLPAGQAGIITLDDLKNYVAKDRTAIQINYHGYEIVSMPLPSSGGIMLQQLLGMIAG